MITSRQIRMARACMRWTVDDLSNKSGIPWARLQYLEKVDEFEAHHLEKVNIIQITFEKEGVMFIKNNDKVSETLVLKKSI
tara:strand:- start:4 stop:246 length:243 start_codon:yes stop_codon:yes gene_type:complete